MGTTGRRQMEDTRKAYLLHSPGFGSSFFRSLVCLGLLHQLAFKTLGHHWDAVWQRLQVELLLTVSAWQWWSLMGLLSSACCLLQVVLNLFSLGCAGFNTYLGPLRPFFLSVTLLLQIHSWRLAYANPLVDWQYTIVGTAVAIPLSLMPEALYLYHLISNVKGGGTVQSVVRLQLEGMGCISCATTVRNLAQQHEAVVDVEVSVNEGIAVIRSTLQLPQAKLQAARLAQEITAVKFPCTVSSVTPHDSGADDAAAQSSSSAGASFRPWLAAAYCSSCSTCCLHSMSSMLVVLASTRCSGLSARPSGHWPLHRWRASGGDRSAAHSGYWHRLPSLLH